jgi:hypothetical protein
VDIDFPLRIEVIGEEGRREMCRQDAALVRLVCGGLVLLGLLWLI